MADLRTNYVDDELATSMQGKRQYNIVDSQGNVIAENVHIEDVSRYTTVGDNFGANDINAITEQVNENSQQLTDILENGMMKKITRYEVTAENMTNASRKSVTINLDNPVNLSKTSFRLVNGDACFTSSKTTFNNASATVTITEITNSSVTVNFFNNGGNTYTLMAILEVLEY